MLVLLVKTHDQQMSMNHLPPSDLEPRQPALPLWKQTVASIGRFAVRHKIWLSSVLGAIALLTSLWLAPAQALDVQIRPSNPQLGDTISVTVQSNTAVAPTVTMNQKTFATFPIGGNRYRALLPTTPLDRPGRLTIQVRGDGEERNLAVGLQNRSFPTQRITIGGGGSSGTDYEFNRIAEFKRIVSPEKYWNGPMLRPNNGPVTSVYGVRRYYNGVFAEDYYHKGVDYAGGQGSAIIAPAAGRVTLVGRMADGFQLHGNTIGIDHGQGVSSIFIHLSRIDVTEGQFVQAGQTIGALGSTGFATGPNLHWGLNVQGESVNPVPWRYDGFE